MGSWSFCLFDIVSAEHWSWNSSELKRPSYSIFTFFALFVEAYSLWLHRRNHNKDDPFHEKYHAPHNNNSPTVQTAEPRTEQTPEHPVATPAQVVWMFAWIPEKNSTRVVLSESFSILRFLVLICAYDFEYLSVISEFGGEGVFVRVDNPIGRWSHVYGIL